VAIIAFVVFCVWVWHADAPYRRADIIAKWKHDNGLISDTEYMTGTNIYDRDVSEERTRIAKDS